MDPTEDLSARVLLKHILTTDTPRTPITRSTSKTQSTSSTRRSTRSSKKDAVGQTPQDLLRRSLKHKMRESISRKSQPPTTRRTTVFRQTPKPAQVSQLFDEEDTPRHILMNILRTEPVKSPVVHKKTEEPQLPSANSSITSKRPSIELSGLELPDITIGNAASTAKGLSRKRPRRSLNVTAFERRLQDGDDVEDNESIDDPSSISGLSLSCSSTSLSLKTPFVDVRTEKRGLQRRVSNRRKITVEEFSAAVKKRHMEGDQGMGSIAPEELGLSETSHSEGFTLGLTKLGEPDITADIINCNTALYAQTDVMTSNLSITATQDKPTVMASQLQREMEQEVQLEVESAYAFTTEEGEMAEPQDEDCVSQSQLEKATAEVQNEEGKLTADCQLEDAVAMSESEDAAESQTIGRDVYEEEQNGESQTEVESAADSQTKDDVATLSQSEEEEDAEECQRDQQDPAGNSQSEEENSVAVSQIEDMNDGKQEDEHISRRAHRSEGGLIVPVIEAEGGLLDATEAGLSEGKSKAHSASDLHSGLEMGGCEISQPRIGSSIQGQNDVSSTEAEPDSDKENSSHLLELKYQDSNNLGDASSEEAAALDTAEQEEEEEEEAATLDPAEQEEDKEEDEEDSAALDSAEQEEDKEEDEEDSAALDPAEQEEEEDKVEDEGEAAALDPAEQEDEEEEAVTSDPAEQEEGWEDEDDDDEEGKDVPMKTPAFVREKRIFSHSDPQASPTTTKNIQTSDGGLPPGKTKQVRQRKTGAAKRETCLPKSYLMGAFKHFAKTKVSADVYPVLKAIMDKFFDRLAEDLETYALHAKRKTIEVEDAELLLKRQGYVNDKVPVEVLIEKYLRMDQRKLLIPIATSGNVVIPKSRR